MRYVVTALLLTALGLVTAGCGQVNHSASILMTDAIPQWAGGLPDGVPPRPGEPGYDEFYRAQMERSLVATAKAWPQRESPAAGSALAAASAAAPAPKATAAAGQTGARSAAARPRGVQSASAEAIY